MAAHPPPPAAGPYLPRPRPGARPAFAPGPRRPMPARGTTRRRRLARRPPGQLGVEPLADRTVPSASLLLATAGDVSNSGAPGINSWSGGTALEFGPANVAQGSGTTDGTCSALF